MKKIVFIICMVLCNTLLAFAQNNQEIVYLKNGDKVKGIIIEEIPTTPAFFTLATISSGVRKNYIARR